MEAFRPSRWIPLAVVPALALGCTDSSVTALPELPASGAPVAARSEGEGVPSTGLYRVKLEPLNASGVHGTATIAVRKDELTVVLNAVGHEVGRTHAQHIHGFTDGTDGSCPPPDFDPDGDGQLTIGEGLPFYGPVQLPLTPFPTPVNQGGAISYKESFPVAGLAFTPEELDQKTMVLHGLTVNGSFVGSTPVACGTVERVN